MNKVWTITKKECLLYFYSPIAYVVMILSLVVFNVLFYMIIDQNREAVLRDMFLLMEFLFVFLVPILTMKTFSEEKLLGTMEFLQTTPTKNADIVYGKYFGSILFYTLLLLFTLPYYVILKVFSAPDGLSILTGYIGIWLEGAFFISVGLFASALSRNQMIAAITTYAALFFLYFCVSFEKFFPGALSSVIHYASTMTHSQNFFIGIVTSTDILYYLSGIFLFLTLTRIAIENRLCR